MALVAVIVAKDETLNDSVAANLRANLPGAQEVCWLNAGKACEIVFSPLEKWDRSQRRLSAAHLRSLIPFAADAGVFETENRKKKLLVADMDSTMIEQECLDELAREAGFYDKVSAITERAMRGEIAFEAALRERVALLKGLPAGAINEVIEKRISLMPGAKTLVATMKANGAASILVSGGFTLFTKPIAGLLGFDVDISNTLLVENGHLTGEVATPILGREGKRETLLAFCARKKLSPGDALAIGDGANDLSMIETAGLGLAYHAKPVLAAAASGEISHGDLTVALYYQGYRQSDFI